MSDSLVDFLRRMRYKPKSNQPRKTNKRINIEPRKSVTSDDKLIPPVTTLNLKKRQRKDFDFFDDRSLAGDEERDAFETSSEESICTGTSTSHSDSTGTTFVGIEKIAIGELVPGHWILVKLVTQRRPNNVRRFLGQILNVYGNADFSVKVVRQYRQETDKFVFPEKEDIADVDFDQIIGKVKPPTVLRRGVLDFCVNSTEW